MAHPNEQVIRQLFEAYRNDDYETLRQVLAEEVVYHIPGNNVFSKDYTGQEALFELWKAQKQRMGGKPYNIQLIDILVNEKHVVALTRVEAQAGEKSVTWMGANVYAIRDGKIAEAWFMLDDLYAYDSFWS
jgi:ketosteroid isomerase-like protein